MKLLTAIFFSSLFCFSIHAEELVGQTANYQLDKNPKRTMSMIKSGTVKTSILGFLETTPQGPAYDVEVSYKMNVAMMGLKEGNQKKAFEREFFAPEFLENLRKNGSYEGKYFKAKHQGYADAKNLDGKFYPHCDRVFIYDIQEPPIFADILAVPLEIDRGKLEDVKVLAHIYPGIPVLGAVKIDLTGKYSGMSVKAGGDYFTP
jgi:hypothetical protein